MLLSRYLPALLPSLREEPGRCENNKSDSSAVGSRKVKTPVKISRTRIAWTCRDSRQFSHVLLVHHTALYCIEYYNAQTNEEFQQLLKWEEQCLVQLQENEILRPDMSKEDGTFELSFLCSVLRKFRTHTNMPSPGDNQGQAANMAGSKK